MKKGLPDGKPFCFGGAKGGRTPGLLHAMQALSQLSYSPEIGAAEWNRTIDLFLTMEALYLLSYSSNENTIIIHNAE